MAVTINGTTGIETNTDTGKVKIGTGDDLQISHNGTDSNIINSTGDLYIHNTGVDADDINIRAQDDINLQVQNGESGINIIGDGAVELYYDNSKKMDTLTDGIGVLGVVYSQGLDVDDDHYIKVGSGDDLQIYHSGGEDQIRGTGTKMEIRSPSLQLQASHGEKYFVGTQDGTVELFYDNTKVFETTGSGISCGEIRSQTTYDSTTTNGANMYVHSSPYVMYRSTSSIKYKDNVTTLTDADADKILNCRPVTYTSKCDIDDSNEIHYGLIAEEVKDVDPRLVVFEGSEPENVRYDRFVPHLINLVKRLTDEVNTLKTKVAALEAA